LVSRHVLLHGLLLLKLQGWIEEVYPRRITIPIPLFQDYDSITDLHTQVRGVIDFVRRTVQFDPEKFVGGYDFVCHSQGALICRAVVEEMDDHLVHTMISLAGPHMGVYGKSQYWLKKMNVPSYMKFHFKGKTNLFYSDLAQRTNSVANMWHDPVHQKLFLDRNTFLPLYNGLIDRSPGNARRKSNFLRLGQLVLLGGLMSNETGDGVVEPAESCLFGFYDSTLSDKAFSNWFNASGRLADVQGPDERGKIVHMRQQDIYIKDTFGLRTLESTGRLVVLAVSGVIHGMWLTDKSVVAKHVLPYLG